MNHINRITLTGNVAWDAEYKEQWKLCSFKLASQTINSKNTTQTMYTKCSLWGAVAQEWAPALKKGARIIVDGRLKEGKWMDKKTNQERTELQIQVDTLEFIESE